MTDLMLVHIAGTGRSGSTLLSMLLNAVPGVCSVGEMTGPPADHPDPDSFLCSCGSALGDDPFWHDIGGRLSTRGHRFGPARWDMRFTGVPVPVLGPLTVRSLRSNRLDDLRDGAVAGSAAGAGFARTAARNVAFAEALAESLAATVVVDGSKDVRRPVLLQRYQPDVDLRVIHLVRGPHGYVSSRRRRRDIPIPVAVREWRRNVHHGQRLQQRFPPSRFRRVRYEDLCADPMQTLGSLVSWMGLPSPDRLPDADAAVHHVIGNHVRLSGIGEIRLDEHWRTFLSHSEQARIAATSRREAHSMGYR